MLTEIRCEKFRKKIINFHNGLNVILGDNAATNSIGKSTLLMVIDFVFGGDSFLKSNQDAIRELGHHEYQFSLEFFSQSYYFKRATSSPDEVIVCDNSYKEKEKISVEEYRAQLKSLYNLNDIDLTFRQIVSLFSRIWGKENLDVTQPLNSFKKQKGSECITNTIKLFEEYDPIKLLSLEVKNKQEEKSSLKSAANFGFIPKVTSNKHKKNLENLDKIDEEINEIRNDLSKFAINISEITNRKIMELSEDKDKLLSQRFSLESRLERVKNDLTKNRTIKSRHLSRLIEFFPDVNIEKINTVEEFHSKMSSILKKELRETERKISDSIDIIDNEINNINHEIENSLRDIDNPSQIIDRVYKLSSSHAELETEVKYFESNQRLTDDLKDAKARLSEEKSRILEHIEGILNGSIRKLVTHIYSIKHRSPKIKLKENSYSFELIDDTGTGKAYSNLILLDLAFLESTKLPFLIHDSVLFKNIQNNAISKLIELYKALDKQVFIALDEIEKYGSKAEKVLVKDKVLSLDNENVLYIKDWRRN